jgi:hypothetical protein
MRVGLCDWAVGSKPLPWPFGEWKKRGVDGPAHHEAGRERIDDKRLADVAEHVRSWLFAKSKEQV